MRIIKFLLLIACVFSLNLAIGQTTHSVPFTFTLSDSARVSAGVFAKDGTLIRTLWSGVSYKPGSYTQIWDGKDDEGRLASDGSYDIRLMSNKVSYTWEGVIGNTATAQSGPTHFRSLENIACMAIDGNTAYYAIHYNEQLGSCYKINTTSPQAKTDVLTKGAMVWLVATDGNKVYWGAADPNKNSLSFVFVTTTADDNEASMANATPVQTVHGRKYTSAISVLNNASSAITGLAVQKTGNFLFVSRQKTNSVSVLNKTTGALVTNVPVNAPRELAIDKDDNLWIISATNTISQYKVNANGTLTATNKSLAGLVEPLALSVSPDGATIVVADGGNSQQLKAFSTTTLSSEWTFGQPNGYVTDPAVTNDKFYFSDSRSTHNPITPVNVKLSYTFVAFQPDGSFWVNDMGNSRVQHYSADRSFIDRIMFLPTSFNCSIDSNDPTRLFSDYLEFKIDYSLPLGPANGSWTLVRNWGAVVPKSHNYNQYLGRFRFVATLSNGRTYSALSVDLTISPNNTYELVELPATGPLRFTGIRFPNGNYQLYPDGSLRVMSTARIGSPVVWQKQPLTGFDSANNPQWGALETVAQSPSVTPVDPVYWGNVSSLAPGETTSSEVIVSFDGSKAAAGHSVGYHLGGIRAGSSKWLWRTAPSTRTEYTGDFPVDGAFDIGNRVNNPGSRALAIDRNIFWGYYGEFWKGTQTNKWHHVYDNGLLVGQFGVTGKDETGSPYALFPAMTGNAFSFKVVKSPTDPGTVYLYHNDDGWHSGVHRWKVSGLGTIEEQVMPVAFAATVNGLLGQYADGRELDNALLKTTRIDANLDANWPAGPTGTALAQPTNFSARWQGFVQPAFSQAYTFYTDTDSRIRLWVNETLVIDRWTNQAMTQFSSPSINLEAGKRYAIRLEYANKGTATRVSLGWSSISQPKQVIPSSQLFPANAADRSQGIDLLEYLSPGKVLEDKLYGWSRNTVAEINGNASRDWWSAKTGFKTYGRNRMNSSDLLVRVVRGTGAYTVNRNLGVTTGSSSWSLIGNLHYEGESGNRTGSGASAGFFEVLDDQGKVLIRLFFSDEHPNLTMNANGKVIIKLPKSALLPVISQVQPISIKMTNGIATIQYGPYEAITAPIVDPSANWQKPRTMRAYFLGGSDLTVHVVGIESMRFIAGSVPSGRKSAPEGEVIELTVSPNPAQSTLQVNYPAGSGSSYLEIYSLNGQMLKSWILDSDASSTLIDVSSLNSAVYLLQYRNGFSKVSTRFVKQ